MCPPAFLEAVRLGADRRSFLGGGTAAALVGAGAGGATAQTAGPTSHTFSSVLDLTHPLFEGFPTFSGEKWFTIESMVTFAKDRVNLNRWIMVEHTGTHMDAPIHFSADGASTAEVPIADLVVPLAVIDIAQRAQDDPDTTLTPEDVVRWEAANGPLREGCCVVMNSGWHRLLDTPRFAGRDEAGKNHTPGFHPETAHLLMAERGVKGIGVDTLSLDAGSAMGAFPVHYAWLGSGRWGVERLANLDSVPAKGAILVLGGPKVKGGTGGPSRVMALV